MKRSLFSLLILSLLVGCARNESKVAVEMSDADAVELAASITEAELKEHLFIYASDEFEGRETGTEGQKKAVQYIVDYYKKLNIDPAAGTNDYIQKVPVKYTTAPTGSASVGNTSLELGEQLVSFTPLDGEYAMVFVGHGIVDGVINNYENLDVEGKMVLAVAGEPKNDDGTFVLTGTEEISKWSNRSEALPKRVDAAKENGAAGLLFVDDDNFARYNRYFSYMRRNNSGQMSLDTGEETLFSGLLKSESLALFGLSKDDFEGKALDLSFTASIQGGTKEVDTENVAAVIEGVEFPVEYVVISSHLDHIGINADGEINNGADDDGSGTVALLEIAEAFKMAKEQGKGPRRTVVFLHVTGEEKGLLGSEYYTDFEPLYPLENTVTNLNIDMIGRIDPERSGDRNYIYLIGSDKLSTDLHELSEAVNQKYMQIELDYTYNDENDPNRFYYRSDHYNFAKNNIPIIFYFNGTHDDYHRESDTPDKINYDLLENRSRLVFHTALEVANRDQKPVVDKAEVEE